MSCIKAPQSGRLSFHACHRSADLDQLKCRAMRKLPKSFAFWFPVANLILATGLLIVPALTFYFRIKHAAHGAATVYLRAGEFTLQLRSSEFLSQGFMSSGYVARRWVLPLNAPGIVGQLLVSFFSEYTGNFYRATLFWPFWDSVIYVIFAIPAWRFVGRGVDQLRKGLPVGRANLVMSVFLIVLSATISVGLWIGLSKDPGRTEDAYLAMLGFAGWSGLFAIPLIAWFRQRHTPSPAMV